jgi:Rrf2 family protein
MLSKKTQLCVKVLVAMASAPPSRPVTVQTLSEHLLVSVSHLESIARTLREAGLVRAARGPGGGYYLACDAQTLTVWEAVQRVDPKLAAVPPASNGALSIAALEASIRNTFVAFLASRTIGEFARSTDWLPTLPAATTSRFKLGPMPQMLRPMAPRSVFELGAFPRSRAA